MILHINTQLLSFIIVLLFYLFFTRNLNRKTFKPATKNLIKQIPYATNPEQVYHLMELIRNTNDDGIKSKCLNRSIIQYINVY